MLTNPQKRILKMAQREAGLDDTEYRDCLDRATGCRSSTDPQLGDLQFDSILKFFEAIYWRKVDRGEIDRASRRNWQVFARRDYWAGKNIRGNTSRDRYVATDIMSDITRLEADLLRLVGNPNYLNAIRNKIVPDEAKPSPAHLAKYANALRRTIISKRNKIETAPRYPARETAMATPDLAQRCTANPFLDRSVQLNSQQP